MTQENNTSAAAVDTKTETNENPGEKTLGFSSMDEQATEPTLPETEAEDNELSEQPEPEDSTDKPEPETDGEEFDYSDVKAPDGFEIDTEVMAEITPILQELHCSKENAAKLVAAGSQLVQKTLDAQQSAIEAQHKKWQEEVLADKELGKEENIAIANRAIETFGDEAFKEVIKAGLGNHPAMVRFCYNIGKAVSEDSAVISTGAAKASNRNELGEPVLQFKNM